MIGAEKGTCHDIWLNVYWRIYAPIGLDELSLGWNILLSVVEQSEAVSVHLAKKVWDKMDAISQTTFLKCIYLNENVWIPIKISLKFVPKGPINNVPALVQIMACRIYASLGLNELNNAIEVAA